MVLIDYPKNGYCHLVADTIPNLHEFASNVGIKKCWFHNKRGKNKPHYDVIEKTHQKIKLKNSQKNYMMNCIYQNI